MQDFNFQSLVQDEVLVALLRQKTPISVLAEQTGTSFDDMMKRVARLKLSYESSNIPFPKCRYFSQKHLIRAMMELKTVHAVAYKYKLTYHEVTRELRDCGLEAHIDFFRRKPSVDFVQLLYCFGYSDTVLAKAFDLEPRTFREWRRKYGITVAQAKAHTRARLRKEYSKITKRRAMTTKDMAAIAGLSLQQVAEVRQEILDSGNTEGIAKRANNPLSAIEVGYLRKMYQLGQF